MYKLSQTIFTLPPLTARFVPAPQQEGAFSLTHLSQRLQTLLTLSDNDTQALEAQLNRHVGEASTFTEKAALCHFLTQIFYHLSQGDISDAQKFSMANALIIDIDKCTNGFYNRASGLFQSLTHAETLEGWLYNIRVDLVEQTARQATSDVHTHNRYFFIASQHFGVRPIAENDAYHGHLTDPTINDDLSFNFSVAHQPLQLINRLAARLEEELLAMGLRTLIDRRQYDQAILDSVVEKIENFLQPASFVVTDIIAFSDGDDEDLQAHPTHLHVNQIKKLIYQRLVRNGILIPEAPDVDALMTEFFDLRMSHGNLQAMGARLMRANPELFCDLIAFLSFKPDAEKLSVIAHAVTHLNPRQLTKNIAITSGYFQDFSLIAEHFKSQILPEFLTGTAWGPDCLINHCRKKSLYQFCLKMILHFEQYDFLMSRSASGETILGVLTTVPSTLDHCLPLICQIPQPYLELLMTNPTIGQRNWLMPAILEQRHPVFAIQQLCHFIQPETLRTMLDEFFEAAIQLDLANPTHGLYTKQWVELCHRVGLIQNIHDYRFGNGRTLLHRACIYKHIPLARCLIENSMNIEVADADGYTALHIAVTQGHLDMAQLLITRRANVEAKTQEGLTPLHIAACMNNLDIATLLIEQAVNLEATDEHQQTALHLAVSHGHLDMAQLLITRRANFDAKTQKGLTPLHIAVINNRLDIATLLIEQAANLEAIDEHQQTALHIAVGQGHLDMTRLLITRGANFEAINENQHTALHIAVTQGHLDMTRLLITRGANFEAKNSIGFTPLHVAAKMNRLDIAILLIEQAANLEAINQNQHTALHLAVGEGHLDMTRLLITRGANFEAKNSTGFTPLHIAAKMNRLDIATYLIEQAVNLEAINEHQRTALHVAVGQGHLDMTRLLITKGANFEAKNSIGFTPLHVAAKMNRLDIAILLIEQAANLEAINEHQRTALHVAVGQGHLDMTRLLIIRGANLQAKNNLRLTPLEVARARGHKQIAEHLRSYLEAQAKPLAQALGLFVQVAKNRCRKRGAEDALAPPPKRP